jgi:Flp pilus assembly protein TadD
MKHALLFASLLLMSCSATRSDLAEGAVDDFDVGGDRPPTVRTMHAMARVLANQGRDGQCELVLHKLVDDHPDFAPAYVELAELYMRNGHAGEAVHVLEVAVDLMPDDPVLQNDLGMALFMRGENQRALIHFSTASALDPSDARPQANVASALGMLGRYEEALDAYLRILPAADAHHNVAVLAEARGDSERALEAYRAATEAALEPLEPAPEGQ